MLVTAAQVAEMLGISRDTVYRLRAVPRTKLGRRVRWKSTDIEKFVENHTIPCRVPLTGDIIVLAGGQEPMPKKGKKWYDFGAGHIYCRRNQKGIVRYYIDYRREGKRFSRVIPHAMCLEDALSELKRELAISGKNVQSFAAWAERYRATHLPHLKKPRTEELRLDNIKLFFKDVRDLRQITPTMVDDFRAWRLKEGNQRSTVNRYTALLKSMLNRAVDDGYMEQNPCRKIKLYSERERECMRVLTPDEEIRLYAELADHIKPIVTIALNTGMRLGEIMNLKWADVDLSKNLLRIENTKAGKVRYVPINQSVSGLLGHHQRRGSKLFDILSPKKGFQAAVRRAAIGSIRFHDLRHTMASRLLAGGADINTVRCILGHSSLAVTQKYVHSNLEQMRQAVEKIQEVSVSDETLMSKAVN